MALSPNQVADCMWIVGWTPPLGISQHADGSVTVTDPQAKKRAIAFYDVALAVCQAESQFNPKAKNTGSSASGLWQIMVSVHKDKIAQEIQRWTNDLGHPVTIFDPIVNTAVAQRVHASGWGPWETYTNGAYKKYLGHGPKVFAYLTSKAHFNQDMQTLTANLTSDAAYAEAATFLSPGGILVNNQLTGWAGDLLAGIAAWALPIGVFVLGAILVILGLWLVAGKPGGNLAKKLPGV